MANVIDITGKRFGRLVAVEPTKERKDRRVIWVCKCDCGNVVKVSSHSLIGGSTKSCGCFSRKRSSEWMKLVANNKLSREKANKKRGYHDGTVDIQLTNKPTKSNTTGVRGISKHKAGKYVASIMYKRKKYHLGYFYTLEEAKEARKIAEKKIWGKDLE